MMDVVRWVLIAMSATMAVVMAVAVAVVMFGPPEEPIHWDDEED